MNGSFSFLFVDNHPACRPVLHSLLESEFGTFYAHILTSTREALKESELGTFDTAVIRPQTDSDSEETDFELISRLRRSCVKTIIITSTCSETWIEDVLCFDPDALFEPDADENPTVIIEAIRNVLAGQRFIFGARIAKLLLQIGYSWKKDKINRLITGHERKILQLVYDVLSYSHIARELHYTEQTVRNAVHRILRKTGCSSGREAAEWAKRRGLLD